MDLYFVKILGEKKKKKKKDPKKPFKK